MEWFPELVAAGCGSEFYFYIWSGYCPYIYSVSQSESTQVYWGSKVSGRGAPDKIGEVAGLRSHRAL